MLKQLTYTITTLFLIAPLSGIQQSAKRRAVAPQSSLADRFRVVAQTLNQTFTRFQELPRCQSTSSDLTSRMQQLLIPLIVDAEFNEQCYLMSEIFEPRAVADIDPYKAKRQFVTSLVEIGNLDTYANICRQNVAMLHFQPHGEYDPVVYYNFKKEAPVTALEIWHDILLNMAQLARDDMPDNELTPLLVFAEQMIQLLT